MSTDSAAQRRARWWNSFYWRLGVSFVVFVVAVISAQSVIFTWRLERTSREAPSRAPTNVSIAAAIELGRALESGEADDLAAYLARRFHYERALYVVMKDGRMAGTSGAALPAETLTAARMILAGGAARAAGQQPRVEGPVVFAPIQAHGELRGVVIMPPPGPRGVLREAARFLSVPNVLLLVATTVVAAFVIFGPARRRLVALESAALRLGAGDLAARAPEIGRDEISQVARAFNHMGAGLASRDEALRRSDQLRRQMLADVSHELKTPLTAMRGFIETLQMNDADADPARRARYLDTVARETRRLDRIVSDLLDLARYESGAGRLDRRVFAIRRVFEHVARRHERDTDERGIAIRIDVDDAVDQVMADPDRLEQVIENLVANALRHVPDGGAIDLRAAPVAEGVALTVVDSGTGIAPEHLPHVFDRLYKADPARAASTAGSGLGLSIVKAIVERHGGTVGVTSEPGRTAFTIVLPV